MRFRSSLVAAILGLLAGHPLAAWGAPATTPGAWIDRMTAALWPSSTVSADATLVTRDDLGAGLDATMKLIRHQDGTNVRTQIRVTAPPRAEGTVYEVLSDGDRPLERMVFSPALERVSDVSGVRRTDAFLGSEFTYEDLDIAAPIESEWRSAEDVDEHGRHLVRVTSAPYSYYSRVEIELDPDSGLPVRVSYYDRAGALYKRATFTDLQTVAGHLLPATIVMENVQTGGRSELRLANVQLGGPFDEKVFSSSPIAARRLKR